MARHKTHARDWLGQSDTEAIMTGRCCDCERDHCPEVSRLIAEGSAPWQGENNWEE